MQERLQKIKEEEDRQRVCNSNLHCKGAKCTR